MSDLILHTDPQGTEAWLAARRGVITASRFKDARDKLKGGGPSKACIGYAQDVARERVGGVVPPKFQNAAMRVGQAEEPVARMMREAETGQMILEAGFITTPDRKFGVSVDGFIGDAGVWECKTMVSSDTLFTAMVDGDISAYRDQCVGAMWLLTKDFVDLSLWCPDLQILHTTRILRDENEIQALEDDLVKFEKTVGQYERALRERLGIATSPTTPPWADTAPSPASAPAALPESLF